LLFSQQDTFVLSLVGKHRTSDNIADRVNAFDLCRQVRIDFDAAIIVRGKAYRFV